MRVILFWILLCRECIAGTFLNLYKSDTLRKVLIGHTQKKIRLYIISLHDFKGTVERLKVIYEEKGKSSLDDDVAEVRQLCVSVEEVLRHQQKGKGID